MQGPYWFPAKTRGWGWGPPATWQGWVVMAVYVAIVATAAAVLLRQHRVGAFMLVVTAATAALVAICWLTGEPPGPFRF